jgi:hypothetical protein
MRDRAVSWLQPATSSGRANALEYRPLQAPTDAGSPTHGGPAQRPQGDGYLVALAKLIPAEVIALFLFVDGFLSSIPKSPKGQINAAIPWAGAGTLLVLLVLTPSYLRKQTPGSGRLQLAFSAAAFAIYAAATSKTLPGVIMLDPTTWNVATTVLVALFPAVVGVAYKASA